MSSLKNIKIVTMKKDHIDKLAELEQICFKEPWSRDSLLAELDNKNSYFIVAVQDNNILGYAGMYCILDEGYITNVAVSPLFRGNGIGKRLLNNLLDHAKKSKFSFITLEVRASNFIAINLYNSLGFSQMGIRKNFYKKPLEDAILMTKHLNLTKFLNI